MQGPKLSNHGRYNICMFKLILIQYFFTFVFIHSFDVCSIYTPFAPLTCISQTPMVSRLQMMVDVSPKELIMSPGEFKTSEFVYLCTP